MPKSFSQLLNSRLNTVLQIIRENQNLIAERQKAEEAEIEHVLSDGYKFKKTWQRGTTYTQRQSFVKIEGGE